VQVQVILATGFLANALTLASVDVKELSILRYRLGDAIERALAILLLQKKRRRYFTRI
jgi:hypothetical protein